MVKVNQKSIYIIGGYSRHGITHNNTWIMDPTDNFKLKEGPPMIHMSGENESAKMMLNAALDPGDTSCQ